MSQIQITLQRDESPSRPIMNSARAPGRAPQDRYGRSLYIDTLDSAYGPGHGSAYRIEVQGPGVTPNLAVVVPDPGRWNPGDPAEVAFQERMKARQLELSCGDKFCPTQT